jgi:hypothetical protein
MTHERKILETTMGMTHTHNTQPLYERVKGISQSPEMNVGLKLETNT